MVIETNEGEEVKEEEEVVIEEIVELEDDEGNDTTNWKEIALSNLGKAKRLKTKVGKLKEAIPKKEVVEKKVEDKEVLDRLDKAVLRVEKITKPEEIALVEKAIKETGRSLELILESKYFQSELQELRDADTTKEAMPDGTKKSGVTTKNDVEYWLAKGELPPVEESELRQKVVNAKIAKEKDTQTFSSNPIS